MSRVPVLPLVVTGSFLGLFLLANCAPSNMMGDDPNPNDPNSPPICQAGKDCCSQGELVCSGDPDKGMVCRCFKAWDCEEVVDPKKCWQSPADTPDGAGDWICKVDGDQELCTKAGGEVPSGKNGWSCYKGPGSNVICQRPVNTPGGGTSWGCHYEGAKKVCDKGAPNPGGKLDGGAPPPPPPPPPPPKQDGGVPKADQGSPNGGWKCQTKNGVTVCKKSGSGVPDGSGTPGGNGNWKCHWKGNTIICEGSSSTPPGGAGWKCVPHAQVGGWRCEKPIGPGDTPPGGGTWGCTSGTTWGGTQCTQGPPSGSGKECIPNEKMWCDGHTYCGWGLVVCGPDGKWKKKLNTKTGKMELDCWEPPSGVRPNTACACYFTYYNKDCCERPDCILPPGTNGQTCPVSPGQYCDHCNALKPECKPGGKCIVTSNNETFCGKDCSGGKPCPAGALCQQIKGAWQCIPADTSCYY